MEDLKDITSGDERIKEVVFALENRLSKGRCGSLKNRRYSDAFVYVQRGETRYGFGSYAFTASAGQIIYLAKNAGYEMRTVSDDYEFIYVDFFFYGEPPEGRKSAVFKSRGKSETSALFKRMLNLWITKGKRAELDIIALLYSVYSDVCRAAGGEYTPGIVAEKIKPAYEYMVEHFAEDGERSYGIMCGITETHFRRLFKKAYGTSPVKYVNKMRIERAQGLILNSNLSMSEIAGIVGFGDVYYFGRIFKKTTGVSPTEYRRVHEIKEAEKWK